MFDRTFLTVFLTSFSCSFIWKLLASSFYALKILWPVITTKKSFFENPPTSAIKSLSNIVYHLNKIQDGNDIFLSKDSRRGLFLKQLAAVTGDVKK